jgi:N-acetylmuramoyl-L-alanine amidase
LLWASSLCAAPAQKSSAKLQAAQTQFSRAEEARAGLNSKPAAERTLADYKKTVALYRRVALTTPRAPEVAEAFLAIGELNSEMGDRFGRAYFQSAVDAYQFLVHEYPASRRRQEALLRIAQLQKDRLGDSAPATKTYEQFLKLYPRSAHRREVQEALAELALLQHSGDSGSAGTAETPAVSARANEKPPDSEAAPPSSGGLPHVKKISTSASTDATRVTIELDRQTLYTSARIHHPERIYFDFQAARLSPQLVKRDVRVTGELLKSIRVAQNSAGVVRIVLEVAGIADYSASVTGRPPQLVVELYPAKPAVLALQKDPAADPPAQPESPATRSEGVSHDAAASAGTSAQPIAPNRSASSRKPIYGPTPPDPLPVNNTSLTRSGANKSLRGGANPSAPQPTRDGQSTLTRTLGLKIGRIVIDPGHGGHDTGTIGPTGLMEKDLCLDVAVRLGKIIEQRLPGAEVVFTRTDDTFVPLERRTEIANETKADLFISIHANSSHNQDARGIETYYLNLKGSPEAMDVAARENATAGGGIHDLQDLVKKIARTEKIDESREFARDIQDSLSKRFQKGMRPLKNRGVRKAPFVVLIGADMPSILTEISFLSNPSDEQMLRKPDYRQRVAEGLYQGVSSYLQNLNSVTYNLPARPPSGRSPSASLPVEQSRNQQ